MSKKLENGLYLFYIKDKTIYPVGLSQEQWNMLQLVGNAVAGDPIRVIDKPMGKVENLFK